jgi:hypothetical protein
MSNIALTAFEARRRSNDGCPTFAAAFAAKVGEADTSISRSVILSAAKDPYTAHISSQSFKVFCPQPIAGTPATPQRRLRTRKSDAATIEVK